MISRLLAFFKSISAAKGERLVTLNDEFRKTKRNLLWTSAATFLFAWSEPSKDGEYKLSVLSDFALSENLLAFSLLTLLLYNWMSFSRELRRVRHLASVAAEGLEEDDAAQRGMVVLERLDTTVDELASALDTWRTQLITLTGDVSTAEHHDSEIRRSLAASREILQSLESQSITVQHNVMAYFECTDQSQYLRGVAQQHEKVAKELTEKIFEVSGEIGALADMAPTQDYEELSSTLQAAEMEATHQLSTLENAKNELRHRTDELIKFAGDLDGQDVRSHVLQDRLVPYTAASIATLSCVLKVVSLNSIFDRFSSIF